MIDGKTKELALVRLNKIEGQIRGLKGMVETERYCITREIDLECNFLLFILHFKTDGLGIRFEMANVL